MAMAQGPLRWFTFGISRRPNSSRRWTWHSPRWERARRPELSQMCSSGPLMGSTWLACTTIARRRMVRNKYQRIAHSHATSASAIIQVFEMPSLQLLDRKSIRANGVMDFAWSPKDNILAYWAAEEGNSPARVCLIEIPTRFAIPFLTIGWLTCRPQT